jgi:5-methylcytosine-specific restriction endonuclease McrA
MGQYFHVIHKLPPQKFQQSRHLFFKIRYDLDLMGEGYIRLSYTEENVVAACSCCNLRKGSRMPRECKMFPRVEPRQPSTWELQDNGRAFPPNYLHQSWRDYLYWDSELES